jgi:hypothetical protein
MEQHFLVELKERMSHSVPGLIVSKNLEDAQRIAISLREHGIGGELAASGSQGLTDFVLSGEADRFLR